jgi:hypothetical protein
VILHGGFAPKDWAPVAAALQTGTDAEFARARREARREPADADAYAADAFVAMLTPHQPAPTDATNRRRSAKPEVVVLVDAIALKRGYVSHGERCEIAGVGPVDIDWVNQLLPDTIVHALIHNGVDIPPTEPWQSPVGADLTLWDTNTT